MCTNHSNLESGATRAQHIAQGYPAVLHYYVSSGRSFDAELIFFLPQRKPWVWHGDQERADTLQTQKRETNSSNVPMTNQSYFYPRGARLHPAASCLVFELLVCGGEHNSGGCVPGVGDPGFGSVQHPLVSLLIGCCGGCTCVATVTCGSDSIT